MIKDALWTGEGIVTATGGTTADARFDVTGVTFDSREVGAGDLFVALEGERDGHDFVVDAFNKGAVAALVSKSVPGLPEGAHVVTVANTLQALEALGVARRAAVHAKIIAVTGSAGKTSTKEALRACLAASGKTHASVKSFNNHVGVPLTLARMPKDADYGVFEIGMNHPGEITPLTKMVRPHVAIVTNVQPVHLEFFKSVEAIADAKGEIFAGLEPGGIAIINRDNPHFERLKGHAANATILGFGEHAGADIHLNNVALQGDGSSVDANINGTPALYRVGAPGQHMVLNSLAVMAAVQAVGADLARAGLALAATEPAEGRGRRHVIDIGGAQFTVVDESYNANPASMRAAIETLGATAVGARGRRIAVLGDMLELGARSPDFHQDLAGPLAAAKIDLVYCCGPMMANLWAALPAGCRGLYGQSSSDLLDVVRAEARSGDVVMIKGSLGSRMRPIVDALLARGRPGRGNG